MKNAKSIAGIASTLALSPGYAFAADIGSITYGLFGLGAAFAAAAFVALRTPPEIIVSVANEEFVDDEPPKKTSNKPIVSNAPLIVSEHSDGDHFDPFPVRTLEILDWMSIEHLVSHALDPEEKYERTFSPFKATDSNALVILDGEEGVRITINCNRSKSIINENVISELSQKMETNSSQRGVILAFQKPSAAISYFSQTQKIDIYGLNDLSKMLAGLSADKRSHLVFTILGDDFDRQTCPMCGRKMPYPSGGDETEEWICVKHPDCTGRLTLPSRPRDFNPDEKSGRKTVS